MVDLYKFLYSKTMENYLRETKYEFDARTAAFIVYRSCLPLCDKFEAYEYIKDNLNSDDMEIEYYDEKDDENKTVSIRNYLNIIEENISKYIDNFNVAEQDHIYSIEVLEGSLYSEYTEINWRNNRADSFSLHRSVIDCFNEIKEIYESREKMVQIKIIKEKIDCENFDSIYYNSNFEPVDISSYSQIEYGQALEAYYYDIPHPFKVGDIVYSKSFFLGYSDKFVIQELQPQLKYRHDSSDMIFWGWGNCDNFERILYHDHYNDYLDFELIPEDKFILEDRGLILMSEFLKGNIHIDTFFKYYKRYMNGLWSQFTEIEIGNVESKYGIKFKED